jgi:hypothetical protein
MPTSASRPAPPSPRSSCIVSSQALYYGDVEISVFAVAGSAARPSERAHIGIKFGRVLFYLEDRQSLASLAEAIGQATDMANAVFGPVQDAFTDAEARARQRFERSGDTTHLS